MPKKFKKDPKVKIPKGGDAIQGKAIFEAQCATCHAIEQVNLLHRFFRTFPCATFFR